MCALVRWLELVYAYVTRTPRYYRKNNTAQKRYTHTKNTHRSSSLSKSTYANSAKRAGASAPWPTDSGELGVELSVEFETHINLVAGAREFATHVTVIIYIGFVHATYASVGNGR